MTVEEVVNQAMLSFLNSPYGVIFILSLVLQVAIIIAFFVMAYNVSKIRQDVAEWFDMEHPLVDDESPRATALKNKK